jgi:hypothetical protein
MGHYLAERYMAASAGGAVASDVERLTASVDGETTLLLTIYAPEDETCFHLFDSGSVALVQRASREAGVAFERILAVESLPGARDQELAR